MLRTSLLLLLALPAWAAPDLCDAFGPPEVAEGLQLADLDLAGTEPHAGLGRAVAVADLNGDGAADLALGAPGASFGGVVLLFYGPLAAGPLDPQAADVVLAGPTPGLRAGSTLTAAGDVDQDGVADLLVGSLPGSGRPGRAWLLSGAGLPPFGDLDDAALLVFSGPPGFGAALAAADVDGDGFAEVAVGSPDEAAVYVYGGLEGGPSTGAARWAGAAGSRAGAALAFAEIGGRSLVVGAPEDNTSGRAAGAVLVLDDALAGGALPPPRWVGAAYDRLGSALLPVPGEAGDDLWLASPFGGALRRGLVHRVPGLSSGPPEASARVRLEGAEAGDKLGSALAAGDLDDDGRLDLVVGAAEASGVAARSGGAWTLSDPRSGRLSGSVAAHHAPFTGALAGVAVAVGDLNGDGFDDAIIGGPGVTGPAGARAGEVWVVLGGADRSDAFTVWADGDGDGWGDPALPQPACGPVAGAVPWTGDCADGDPAVHPYALETNCAVDQNCDGQTGAGDHDGDGHPACGDCDDRDAAVAPGLPEHCGNHADDDCDGSLDERDAVEAQVWRPDADGDGYGAEAWAFPGCEPPTFLLVPAVAVGGDCADEAAAVHPGAPERCDEVDEDCDGQIDEEALDARRWFADADADGHGDLRLPALACDAPEGFVASQDDCHDGDAAVHPGAAEVCDALDNDCDGAAYLGGAVSLAPACAPADAACADRDAWVALTDADLSFGGALAFLPDWDGDGRDELLVTAPRSGLGGRAGGAAWVVAGGRGALSEATTLAQLQLSDRGAELGAAVAVGDLDGDGVADLALGAPFASVATTSDGAVFVWYGPVLASRPADAVLAGPRSGSQAGAALAASDLDGDGVDDLIVGAPRADGGGLRRGQVHRVYGGARWSFERLADHPAWPGAADRDGLGSALAAVDLDGDGAAEVLAGAPDAGALDEGYVAVLAGAAGRTAPATVFTWTTSTLNLQLGRALAAAGDVDGDGLGDALIGSNGNVAWVVYGGPLASGPVGARRATELDGPTGAFLGGAVAGAGDVDGDGFADLWLGGEGDDLAGLDAGAGFLIYGGALGARVDAAALESLGRTDADGFPTWSTANLDRPHGARVVHAGALHLGRAVAGGGDVDGDGQPDLLLGADGAAFAVRAGRYGMDVGDAPAFLASQSTWIWDRDTDTWGDQTLASFPSCPMHVPISFADPADPRRKGVLDPALATDCDDLDPRVYRGAPDVPGDGVDSDCDGLDTSNQPPVATACVITPWPGGLLAWGSATDADGDDISWSFTWHTGGEDLDGGALIEADELVDGPVRATCTPSDRGGPGEELRSAAVSWPAATTYVDGSCSWRLRVSSGPSAPAVTASVRPAYGERAVWSAAAGSFSNQLDTTAALAVGWGPHVLRLVDTNKRVRGDVGWLLTDGVSGARLASGTLPNGTTHEVGVLCGGSVEEAEDALVGVCGL